MGKIRQVRRADGSVVPFRERKISDAVTQALRHAGTEDHALAEELSGVVLLFLERYHADAIPTLADIEEMVKRVLTETGHPKAARSFEDLQSSYRRLEEEVVVRYPRDSDEMQLGVEVAAWDRDRLLLSLEHGRGLPPSLADVVATAVERRVVQTALHVITPTLVVGLIEAELIERSLASRDENNPRIGPRLADVGRLLGREDRAGPLPDRIVAGEILGAYARTEIHSAEVIQAHRGGEIFIHGLDDPFRLERILLPLRLITQPGAERSLRSIFLELRAELTALRDHVRSEIVLVDLVAHLARHPETIEDPERTAADLLLVLDFRGAYQEHLGPRAHLWLPIGGDTSDDPNIDSFSKSVLLALKSHPERRESVTWTLVFSAKGLPRDPEALDQTVQIAGELSPVSIMIPREGDLDVLGEQLSKPVPLRLSIGRVAINLPRVLAATRDTDIARVLPALDRAGSLARQAQNERFWHQRSGTIQGLHAIVVRLGGPEQVQVRAEGQEIDVEVWGLSYALELLEQRGVIRKSDHVRAAARLLGYLDYLLGGEVRGVRFRVRLGGASERDLRRDFLNELENCAGRFGATDLMQLLKRGVSPRPVLPVTVPLFDSGNAPLTTTPAAERVAPGFALPFSALAEPRPSAALVRLRDETRLGVVTLTDSPNNTDLFEVQEELF